MTIDSFQKDPSLARGVYLEVVDGPILIVELEDVNGQGELTDHISNLAQKHNLCEVSHEGLVFRFKEK